MWAIITRIPMMARIIESVLVGQATMKERLGYQNIRRTPFKNQQDLPVNGESGFVQALLLLLAGDVELNPGPRGASHSLPASSAKPPDRNKVMQEKLEGCEARIGELESLVKAQARLIEQLKEQQVQLVGDAEIEKVEVRQRLEDVKVVASKDLSETRAALEARTSQQQADFESQLHQEVKASMAVMVRLQNQHEESKRELKKELETLNTRFGKLDALGYQSADTCSKVRDMEVSIGEIQERLWELDKSWKNNLVFYGVKGDSSFQADEPPSVTEAKVREVIAKRMHITRDIPLSRVRRTANGPDVRGYRPIMVCFEKYSDKDEILRKASLLRGSSIQVGEDFTKKVKDQRLELQKFMKHSVKKKRPEARCKLLYDKLIVDNEVWMFNDTTGHVEQVSQGDAISPDGLKNGKNVSRPTRSGRRSSPRRIQKSYSTDSSLHNIVATSPAHVSDSGEASRNSSRDSSPIKLHRGSPRDRKQQPQRQQLQQLHRYRSHNGYDEEDAISRGSSHSPLNLDFTLETNGVNGFGGNGGLDAALSTTSEANSEDEILFNEYQGSNSSSADDGTSSSKRGGSSNPDIPETIPE